MDSVFVIDAVYVLFVYLEKLINMAFLALAFPALFWSVYAVFRLFICLYSFIYIIYGFPGLYRFYMLIYYYMGFFRVGSCHILRSVRMSVCPCVVRFVPFPGTGVRSAAVPDPIIHFLKFGIV